MEIVALVSKQQPQKQKTQGLGEILRSRVRCINTGLELGVKAPVDVLAAYVLWLRVRLV